MAFSHTHTGDLYAPQPVVSPADGAPNRAVPKPAGRSKNAVKLEEVKRLLEQNKPQRALEAIGTAGAFDPELANAKAVCLLRLGDAHAAVDILRPLVLQHDSVVVRSGVPQVCLCNFATALLLDRNVNGCRNVLSDIQDKQHPIVRRLEQAIDEWFRSLSIWQRLNWHLGGCPNKPVTLNSAPGLLSENDLPPHPEPETAATDGRPAVVSET